MNISIIIPNYNGENILKKNLPEVYNSVKSYSKGFVEIIIPDDPSTDNSKQVIQDFIQSIIEKHITATTIENKKKSEAGFSKNVNRGVSLATGDILILLNSDVAPHIDFLRPLLSHFDDPNVFAVGCMDESIENGNKVLRGRGIGKWERGFLMHSEGKLDKNNSLWVSGGSGAFRKSMWNKLSGLDNLYNPFYWEDIDLSYRALKAGYTIVFEKQSIVRHEHETGAIKSKFKSKQINRIAYRNQFIFVWKNITQRSLLTSHFLWLPYHMITALVRRDLTFISGFLLALVRLGEIRFARERAQRIFVKKDTDILKEFTQ